MPDNQTVFVVSYYDHNQKPVVTVWNNKEAAEKHYTYELNNGHHKKVCIDECPILTRFLIDGE